MSGQPSGVARFFGHAMITVGVLTTLLSGGCTLFVLGMGLTVEGSSGLVGASLVVGLPFIAVGIGLILGGRALARRRRREPPDNVF